MEFDANYNFTNLETNQFFSASINSTEINVLKKFMNETHVRKQSSSEFKRDFVTTL